MQRYSLVPFLLLFMFFSLTSLKELVLGVDLIYYVRKNVYDCCDVPGFLNEVRFVSFKVLFFFIYDVHRK